MSRTGEWTGRSASALQAALRLSNEKFAEKLGIGARTVASWHKKPDLRPQSEMQQILDSALQRASDAEHARFSELLGEAGEALDTSEADRRLAADPHIGAALEWLDRHARWSPGTGRRTVASRVTTVDAHALHDRATRRAWVSQRDVMEALTTYYGRRLDDHGLYGGRCGELAVNTSVLTCSEWLDLECELRPQHDRLTVATRAPEADLELDEHAADVAVQRLAETLSMNTRLVNGPIYRLMGTDIREHHLGGAFGITHFVHYALTMDLLEGELVDSIASELLILDHDQTGELVVPADQVEPEPSALHPQPARSLCQPAHRRGQPARVHRVGRTLSARRVVDVSAPEQLLLQFASQCCPDPRVRTMVHQRPVERFGNDRQPARRVKHASGSLLDEQQVVRSAAVRVGRPRDRGQREYSARA